MPAPTKFSFPFGGGLSQKHRAEVLEPGAFLQLTNSVQNKRGAYDKRRGNLALSTALTTGGNITAGTRLIAHNGEQLVLDRHNLYAYSPTAGASALVDKIPEPAVSRAPIVQPGTGVFDGDVASANGYTVVCYGTSNAVNAVNWQNQVIVLDAANGSIVRGPENIVLSISNPKCQLVTLGNRVYLCATDDAQVLAYYLDTTSLATIQAGWSASTQIAAGGAGQVDVFASPDGSGIFTAQLDGGVHVLVKKYNATLTALLASVTVTLPGLLGAVGLGGTDILWISLLDLSGKIEVVALNLTTLATVGTLYTGGLPAEVGTSVGIVQTGAGTATVVAGNGPSGIILTQNVQISAGVVVGVGSLRANYSQHIDSRPFAYDGRVYVMTRHFDTDASDHYSQRVQWCLDITDTAFSALREVARVAVRLSVPFKNPGGVVFQLWHMGAQSAGVFLSLTSTQRTSINVGLELVTLDFTDPRRWQAASTNPLLVISGGAPCAYDGSMVAELGFSTFPNLVAASAGGAGSVSGTVSYVAVYEWFDSKGNREVSAPSIPFQVAGLASNSVNVQVSTLQVTSKFDIENPTIVPRIVLYRTQAGLTTFYRLSGLEAAVAFTLEKQTIVDNLSDSQIATNEVLYSQPNTPGTALARKCPPALSLMIAHKDRVVGVADDGTTVWFSGQAVSGERPWFSDLFQFPVPDGGKITGLASLDGRLVIFKKNAIFFVDGDGPPDNGIGGDYGPPVSLPTDAGCIEPRSIVVTHEGVTFQSPVGLYILSRSQQVSYFGEAVDGALQSNPVITSSVVDRQNSRIFFTCVPADGAATGITISYDYNEHMWSTFTKYDQDTANASGAAVSAALVNGSTYSWLSASGRVYAATTATYLDAGTFVSQTIETPNLKLAGLQGYQRVWEASLLMVSSSPHDLRVSFAYDYAATYSQVEYFQAQDLATLDREQLRIILRTQQCQAVRVKIEELAPTIAPGIAVGSGQGAAFLGIDFMVGLLAGFGRRQQAAQR